MSGEIRACVVRNENGREGTACVRTKSSCRGELTRRMVCTADVQGHENSYQSCSEDAPPVCRRRRGPVAKRRESGSGNFVLPNVCKKQTASVFGQHPLQNHLPQAAWIVPDRRSHVFEGIRRV